ncbi:MAG: CaiB/BaiF CoA transferase family protein [bacterium]
MSPKVNGESYCAAMVNRNKRSLAIDLKDPRGMAVFMALAKTADVVIDNMRPDAKFKLGIDHESLKPANPRLIYASISGFGQTGPYAKKGGYDMIAQGVSGIMRMTGGEDGRPAKVGIAIHDIAGGVSALYAIIAALFHRERHGEGQDLEPSLVDAGIAWMAWETAAFFGAGEVAQPTGTRHRRSAPYQAYRTRDGYMTVGANTERMWVAFCREVLGAPGMLTDPRFASLDLRLANVEALQDAIESVTCLQPTTHWVPLLDAHGIPGGPVYTFDKMTRHPHIAAREMCIDVEHPKIGPMKMLGFPVKFSALDLEVRRPGPWLGQHSAEVLAEAGLDPAEVEAMFVAGVVYDKYRG